MHDLVSIQVPQPGGTAPNREPKQGQGQQQLSERDKQKIQALARNLMQQASDAQKQQMMQVIATRLPPARLVQMRAKGQNPLAMLFQQEATKRFMAARRNQMEKQPAQHHPATPQWNPETANNMHQVRSRSETPSLQYAADPIHSVRDDIWADDSSVIDLTRYVYGVTTLWKTMKPLRVITDTHVVMILISSKSLSNKK